MKINPRIMRRHRTPAERIEHLSKRLFRVGQREVMNRTITLGCGEKMPCHVSFPEGDLRQPWKLRNLILKRIAHVGAQKDRI